MRAACKEKIKVYGFRIKGFSDNKVAAAVLGWS